MTKGKYEKAAEELLRELDFPIGAAHVRLTIVNGKRTLLIECESGLKTNRIPKNSGGYPVIHRTRTTGLTRN